MAEKLITDLRSLGKRYLSLRSYKEAAKCYLALLQLHEGLSGKHMAACRRRFGLTLAECHCRIGDTEEAIARFSDVVDELPVFLETKEDSSAIEEEELEALRLSMARALHLRGLSFKTLGLAKFAYLDISLAVVHNPADPKLFDELDILRRECKDENFEEEDEEGAVLKTARMDQTIFVENLQENYPRPTLTSRQISSIAKRKVPVTSSLPANGVSGLGAFPSNGAGMGSLGEMGSLLGAMGSGGSLGGILKFLPIIGSMVGLSAESVNNASEIMVALGNVFSSLHCAYKFVTKNSSTILLSLAVLFLVYSSNC